MVVFIYSPCILKFSILSIQIFYNRKYLQFSDTFESLNSEHIPLNHAPSSNLTFSFIFPGAFSFRHRCIYFQRIAVFQCVRRLMWYGAPVPQLEISSGRSWADSELRRTKETEEILSSTAWKHRSIIWELLNSCKVIMTFSPAKLKLDRLIIPSPCGYYHNL